MADKTGIEWTDATWNPVTGCAKVSAGCKHCYAERNWVRLQHLPAYAGRAFTDVATHEDRLEQPLRWKRPRRIFVNSMSDVFHPDVSDAFIDKVIAIMALNRRHVFQVLTKRPERMRKYLGALTLSRIESSARSMGYTVMFEERALVSLPLPNVWLGVSVEDQATADERIPLLLETPAAVRWISAEPLLGPLRLHLPTRFWGELPGNRRRCNHCCNGDRCDDSTHFSRKYCPFCFGTGGTAPIDWLVVGGESGSKARPMNPEWVRSLRDQCAASGVPFLFKQWGEWLPMLGQAEGVPVRDKATTADGWVMGLAGKKAAGRRLDGALHDGYPAL